MIFINSRSCFGATSVASAVLLPTWGVAGAGSLRGPAPLLPGSSAQRLPGPGEDRWRSPWIKRRHSRSKGPSAERFVVSATRPGSD